MTKSVQVYYRKSTEQWVLQATGTEHDTSYSFRYAHKYKWLAKLRYWISISADIKSLRV